MLLFNFLTVFLQLTSLSFAANMVEPTFNNNQLNLGRTLQQSLNESHKDFKVLSRLSFSKKVNQMTKNKPMAALGNFNGDDVQDIVFYGYSKLEKKFFIYVALSNPSSNKYELQAIHQREFLNGQSTTGFTTFVSKGNEIKIEDLNIQVIQIETFSPDVVSVEPYYYSPAENRILPFTREPDSTKKNKPKRIKARTKRK